MTIEDIVADLVRKAPWNPSEEEKRDEYLDFLSPKEAAPAATETADAAAS